MLPLISIIDVIVVITTIITTDRTRVTGSNLLVVTIIVLRGDFNCLLNCFANHLFGLPLTRHGSLTLRINVRGSKLNTTLTDTRFSPLTTMPDTLFDI